MKSKFRKLTAWLLTSAMLFTLLPATAFAIPATHSHAICGAAHTDIGDHTGNCEDITWTAWDGTGTPSGNVYLADNGTLTDTLTISTGTVNLCLNGKTITNKTNITVNSGATLNICDCSEPSTGKITGNGNSASRYGGGVYIDYGTVNLYGGSITGNRAQQLGAGVYVTSNGTFNMYAGNITGNYALLGDGVYVHSGTFNMSGGEITGNGNNASSQGGGVYLNSGTFNVSGSPVITGNTVGGKADNVYLPSGKAITVNQVLEAGASIGVKMAAPGVFAKPDGTNVTNLADYVNFFTSDDSGFEIIKNDKGELELKKPTIPVTDVVLDKSKIDLYLGKTNTATLTATVKPADATNKAVTWSSDNEDVATVYQNGVVTAVGKGYTKITATAADGSGVSDSLYVYVYKNIESVTINVTPPVVGETVNGNNFSVDEGQPYYIHTTSWNGTLNNNDTNVIVEAGQDYQMKVVLAGNYGYFDDDTMASIKIGDEIITEGVELKTSSTPSTCSVEYIFNIPALEYTVTFNSNGGSGTMIEQTIEVGTETALSPNSFTRSGYKFSGWATSADGAKVYNDQQSVTDLAKAGESITLFAVWNKIPANAPAITSQPQGFEGANALTYGSIGTDKKLSVETDADTDAYDVTYQWYKNTTNSKDGATAVSGGTSKDLVIESDLNAGDYYYYCKITVTRKDNGESTSVDADLVKVTIAKADPSLNAPEAITNLIYNTSAQLLADAGLTTGGTMQYSLDNATWTDDVPTGTSAGEYTIYYKVIGNDNYNGVEAQSITVNIAKAAQLAPKTPAAVNETIKAKADGKITGVTSDMEYKSEGANEYIAISETEIANLAAGTYLVRYKEDANHLAGADKQLVIADGAMIAVSFNSNEGTAVDSITCEYNQAITAPAEPTKEEFEFVGWYLEDTLTTKWTNEYQFTADTTLYAKWVQGAVSDHVDHVDEVEADGLNDVAKAEGTDITLVVQVEPAADGDAEQSTIKEMTDAPNNFGFYDITLEKSTGGNVTNASSVIEIKLPYDFTRKTNIKVYRHHSDVAEELAQLEAKATVHYVDGKCYVDKSNNCIYIYSSMFSTYAVAYDAVRSSSGGGTTRYTVKFDTDGGSSVSSATVTKNAKVTEPKSPEKDGYTFGGWYTDKELTEKYDFESKVTKNFTLFAKWDKHDDEQSGTDTHNCPSLAFDDLDITKWYHLDTDYVIENGIFKGTTETTFEPDAAQTRAMMVTVLYRAEGEPAVNRNIPFADVDMGAYYANAVIWGQQNGIIKGYSETEFGPDDKITREQIAAIMHRYAQYKGIDVSVGENTNILSYDDFADISEYAISSMQWACGSGLIKGRTESTLNPKDNATRAEIAAILHRFIEANK